MKPTIEDLSKRTTLNASELTELIERNFGERSGLEQITKNTKIEEFPEHLQGQIGITAWAFTEESNQPNKKK
ncbi:hypothetical protein LC605_25620 [Nostoc sp. CHAB 5836]|uniref:hypothetical protein n=1 Tax=Nostoc sp. CHAB 5836 TaxID=2780404 RepID=UPI001E5B151F|nr:hypothetical protein [Nostoc sp. CHAB 5836]MCC5618402.1 hypothetical protein [Nostoc sp. CHAB 5836]